MEAQIKSLVLYPNNAKKQTNEMYTMNYLDYNMK